MRAHERNMVKRFATNGVMTFVLAATMAHVTAAPQAQTIKPTPAELAEWDKDADAKVLETSPCRKVLWLLESDTSAKNPIHNALGWWGRGFIEGAVYMIPGGKAEKAAADFGLSVDVVASHIQTYCYSHQTEHPAEAIQELLLKVLKTAGH